MPTDKTSSGSGGSGDLKQGNGSPSASPFGHRRDGPAVNLGELDPVGLQEMIDAVLDTGALLSIGRTSDGGAIGFYVTQNGQRFKEWASTSEQMEAIVLALHEWGVNTR